MWQGRRGAAGGGRRAFRRAPGGQRRVPVRAGVQRESAQISEVQHNREPPAWVLQLERAVALDGLCDTAFAG